MTSLLDAIAMEGNRDGVARGGVIPYTRRVSDVPVQIAYNEDLQPLEELLRGVQRAGDFFMHGAVEIPMPKVEVEGVGVLSFPVPPVQIAALIQHAVRAPYGRGEDTVLDESVRKVWQLPPEKVRLGGKSWAANFDGILQQVVAGLGCEGMAVSAELYKLLVYDTGGFFLAHRDTEKAGGMFGTLVLVLPSPHCGGELVLRHAGREVTVDMCSAEVSEAGFVAFYADCEHEVRPITEGNRVCLVFNLVQDRGGKGKAATLDAPDYAQQAAGAAALLGKALAAEGGPAKIAWLLEHQYSPDGLSFAGLKSADAARAKVLVQAAERAGCAVHLGIVHIEESGSAEENYDPGSHGLRRYRDDENEDEETDHDDFEIIEVCDWRHYVGQWRDVQDRPAEFGEIPILPGELLPGGALDDEEPDEQRLLEASGNEGASFERSYHRAALVIWRRERHAEVLLQAGVEAALPYLQERIEACEAKSAPPAARTDAVTLARQLVNAWINAPECPSFETPGRPEKRDGMLHLLTDLGDAAVLEQFVAVVVTRDYDGTDNTALVAGAGILGAEKTGRLLSEMIHEKMRFLHGPCVDLLGKLVGNSATSGTSEWKNALCQIAAAAVGGIDAIGPLAPGEWVHPRVSRNIRKLDAALVAKLLNALGKLDATALRGAAAEKLAARPAVFDPVTVLVPALNLIRERDHAVARLWEHSAEFLLQRSGRPPEPPKDWRQDVTLSCPCADCRELHAFTLDPVEQVHRFRIRQDRRNHLEQMIRQHGLDMNHTTDRKGSPQTLVCTKDRRTYRRRCKQYRDDIAALASLEERAKNLPDGKPGTLDRIATARSLAAGWSPD